MKKIIATLLTLCMVTVVIPTASNENNVDIGDNGISLHAYCIIETDN